MMGGFAIDNVARIPMSGFKKKMIVLLDRIDAVLPDIPSDLAMFALAITLGERIRAENDDIEEREACFNIMIKIVQTGVEEEFE